ncbi:MarR family winged helix-turn-helix transcriptional regulator [Microbulbifer sp. CnH-101-G]|uniref:MarR family winged helix-turn-helix transcriptional regulator n=1 Tax=Microbulbifer sp. CnH-101-G TaxID=3243393 RepID=UPI00403A57F4
MNIEITSRLLERLSSLLRSEGRGLLSEYGLQPVQLEALHYLSQCNRYSNTPIAVAEYLRQTKGTVSQTLKVLEKKQLIVKTADQKDKRVSHMTLTTQGQAIVSTLFPSPWLKAALASMPEAQQEATEESLRKLLQTIQQQNRLKAFGQCRHCDYNQPHGEKFLCGLTGETLTPDETQLICREYTCNKATG